MRQNESVPLIKKEYALERLFDLTREMLDEGVSLLPRVVKSDTPFIQYAHYPKGEAKDPLSKARYFYHAHKPEERQEGEHGHFHIFMHRDDFQGVEPYAAPPEYYANGKKSAPVVHIIALNFDVQGMPMNWFTVNQWVTTDHMMPAQAIIDRIGRFNVDHAERGDPLVNQWMTMAVALFRDEISDLLRQRDQKLSLDNPAQFKDKSLEILSSSPFDL